MSDSKYPADWQILPLHEITDTFLSGGTPSTSVPEYWNGTIPWITGADAEQRTTITARKYITERGVRESATNVVPKGNILLVTRTVVGNVSVSGVDVAISQDLTGVVPKQDVVDVSYLYRQLSYFGPELRKLAQGTIIQGVQREEVEALRVPLPPLPEQRRIAEILDTADEAIRQMERLIAKLKAVKAGLLHDLLTRGLDERGRLRDPQANPEQFKDSPLGRIPGEWKVTSLAAVGSRDRPYIKTGPFGSTLKGEHWVEEGVPVITIGSLGEGEFIRSELLFISEKKAQALASYAVIPGDSVFSRVADVGRSVVVGQTEDNWIMSSNLMRISLDRSLAVPGFAHLNLDFCTLKN